MFRADILFDSIHFTGIPKLISVPSVVFIVAGQYENNSIFCKSHRNESGIAVGKKVVNYKSDGRFASV